MDFLLKEIGSSRGVRYQPILRPVPGILIQSSGPLEETREKPRMPTWLIVVLALAAVFFVGVLVAFVVLKRRRALASAASATPRTRSQPNLVVLRKDDRDNEEVAREWVNDLWQREEMPLAVEPERLGRMTALERVRRFQNLSEELNMQLQLESSQLLRNGYSDARANAITRLAADVLQKRLSTHENSAAMAQTF